MKKRFYLALIHQTEKSTYGQPVAKRQLLFVYSQIDFDRLYLGLKFSGKASSKWKLPHPLASLQP
jgi:hypothetical protein